MEELWKPVVGFEGFYEVSDHGRVRSVDRVVAHKTGGRLTLKGRLMVGTRLNAGKYPLVNLWKDGRQHPRYVHSLVLEAFVGPRPEGFDACHQDGSRDNNHVANLRWDTRKANLADAFTHGTFLHGEKAPWSKLTLDQVMCIRGDKRSARLIAQEYGVCRQAIDDVRNGKNWSRAIAEAA